jgi:glutamate synthase (NADPH/NADH) large chain
VAGGGGALRRRLEEIRAEVSAAVRAGARIIVLSDRRGGGLGADCDLAPIPSLLLTGAVHHHMIAERIRSLAGLIVESGDARECHHIALLIGYGAAGVCPYLAIESVQDMVARGTLRDITRPAAARNLVKALGKGVLKIMSKMGVSTVASYTGAQIFEAIGLGPEVIGSCFAGTSSRLGGVGFDELADDIAKRHARAYPPRGSRPAHHRLDTGGEYQWRRDGEHHLFSPEAVFRLQHATRSGREEVFREYTRLINDQSAQLMTLRGLLRIRGVDEPDPDPADGDDPAWALGQSRPARSPRPPVPLEEVEPVESIVRRFSTGAMSYGSISAEAHETLAIAMNRLGGRSNTGEGGEDAVRFIPDAGGDSRRSAVKQVASGRFGVTSEYLVNADDLQIKMAQGAKPGEGGQLPGNKVYPWIASTRHSTPGVGLISPPPHHDIYSIEDLKQLIHDLKNANPRARVHVKLVAEVGVGTVAAGVSKAHADVVLISGHDGGTGAAPLTSIKHAGAPWELGLAETQQTLLRNGLRDRIVVQVDGQLKTGRDVIIAALLGAEEFGFATAPLVVAGCVLMRVCHLDTCPVGVATQNPELRRRAGVRGEFLRVPGPGGARVPGHARLPHPGRGGRPGRAAGRRRRDRALEGGGPGPAARAAPAGPGGRPVAAAQQGAGSRPGSRPGQHADPAGRGRARPRHAGPAGTAGPEREPDHRHHARQRADQAVGRRGPAGQHDRRHLAGVGRAVVRRVPAARHHAAAGRRRQ